MEGSDGSQKWWARTGTPVDGRASLALGADGAEQIGAAGAQVGNLAWARASAGPRPGCAGSSGRSASRPGTRSMGVAGGCSARIAAIFSGKFSKCLQGGLVVAIVPRPSGDVAEAQPVQKLADGALVVVDARALADQRLQIGAAPPGKGSRPAEAGPPSTISASSASCSGVSRLGLPARRGSPARRHPRH